MAALTQNVIDADGLTVSLVPAAVGGDTAVAGPGSYLEVLNGSGGSLDVVIATPGTVSGLPIGDRTVPVGAGIRMKIALGDEYRDPTTGRASLTYPGGVTTLTVGSFRR